MPSNSRDGHMPPQKNHPPPHSTLLVCVKASLVCLEFWEKYIRINRSLLTALRFDHLRSDPPDAGRDCSNCWPTKTEQQPTISDHWFISFDLHANLLPPFHPFHPPISKLAQLATVADLCALTPVSAGWWFGVFWLGDGWRCSADSVFRLLGIPETQDRSERAREKRRAECKWGKRSRRAHSSTTSSIHQNDTNIYSTNSSFAQSPYVNRGEIREPTKDTYLMLSSRNILYIHTHIKYIQINNFIWCPGISCKTNVAVSVWTKLLTETTSKRNDKYVVLTIPFVILEVNRIFPEYPFLLSLLVNPWPQNPKLKHIYGP